MPARSAILPVRVVIARTDHRTLAAIEALDAATLCGQLVDRREFPAGSGGDPFGFLCAASGTDFAMMETRLTGDPAPAGGDGFPGSTVMMEAGDLAVHVIPVLEGFLGAGAGDLCEAMAAKGCGEGIPVEVADLRAALLAGRWPPKPSLPLEAAAVVEPFLRLARQALRSGQSLVVRFEV